MYLFARAGVKPEPGGYPFTNLKKKTPFVGVLRHKAPELEIAAFKEANLTNNRW